MKLRAKLVITAILAALPVAILVYVTTERLRAGDHRAILDEIWARNPDGARRAMHRLMDLTERNITSALSRRHGEAMAAADASREHDA